MSNIKNQFPSLGPYFEKPNLGKKKHKKQPSWITARLNEESSVIKLPSKEMITQTERIEKPSKACKEPN